MIAFELSFLNGFEFRLAQIAPLFGLVKIILSLAYRIQYTVYCLHVYGVDVSNTNMNPLYLVRFYGQFLRDQKDKNIFQLRSTNALKIILMELNSYKYQTYSIYHR